MSTPTEENPNEPRATESEERRLRLASDLGRLEALIAQLEREQWTSQLPRAAQLRPVPGFTRAGERFDHVDQPPPWLKPEPIIPPAMMRRREHSSWRLPSGILLAAICLLPIAYYFVGGWPRSPTDPHPQLASIATKSA